MSGKKAQGALFGWFAMAGSMARIFFPVLAGYISCFVGAINFMLVIVPLLLASGTIVIVYRNLLRGLVSSS